MNTQWHRILIAVLVGLVAFTSGVHAQGCISCPGEPGVEVSPDGQAAPNRIPNTGSYTATFTVTNIGPNLGGFIVLCGASGTVSCAGVTPNSFNLGSQQSRQVTATYSVGNVGSGVLTVTATTSGVSDSGTYTVAAVLPAGAPRIDVAPYNFDKQNYGRCAAACFALTYTQATVPYFSLDAARSVALAYNSDRVNPLVFVHVNVTPDSSYSPPPDEYRFQVRVNGAAMTFVNGESTLHFDYIGPEAYRLGGEFSASTFATGVYPLVIVVSAVYGSTVVDNTWSTQLVVVNETTSSIARGWTVLGVERLYSATDGSALITEGDGSATYFAKVGGNWTAPAGEFSRLIAGTPNGGSGWTRLFADSSKLAFNTAGLMTEIRDAFNNITTVVYDGSNRVSQIKDPLNLSITLTYDANGLDYVTDPASRVTQVTVDASKRLTLVQDPDLIGTTFGYDASNRLSSVTNRRGYTTTFGYDTQSGKLASSTSPSVTFVGANGSDSTGVLTANFSAWQKVGVPFGTTSPPFAPPRADTIYARITDAGGHTTRMLVNRWGTPQQVMDPLNGVASVVFDGSGLPVKSTAQSGGTDTVAYNASGLPVFTRSGSDSAAYVHYTAWARPDTVRGYHRPTQLGFIGANGRVDSTRIVGHPSTHYVYETHGRVERTTDPENHLLSRTWYAGVNGNHSKDSLPGGRVTVYYQDAYGRDTAVKHSGVPLQRTRYDIINRPIRFFDGVNDSATVTSYDSLYATSVRDPKLQVYGFTYNAIGLLTQRTDPQGRSDLYAYGRDGELRRWTNRRGQAIAYTYDALGRKVGKSGTNTTTESWTYSADGRVVSAASPSATDSIYLSQLGRADSAKTILGGQNYWRRYRYDVLGRLDSLTPSGPGAAFRARKYTYDNTDGVLSGVALSGSTTTLGHNNDLLPTTQTLPGGPVRTATYYSLHGEADIRSTAAYNFEIARAMSFDSLGRVAREVRDTGLVARDFRYDGLGRLDSVIHRHRDETENTCEGNPIIDENGNDCVGGTLWQTDSTKPFTYDAVGNRTDHGGTYGTGNRIQNFDGCTYNTDFDGNVTQRTCGSEVVAFTWSAENRLSGYTIGVTTVALYYDASSRLVRKDLGGSATKYFLWDGDNLLAELNGDAIGRVAEYSYLGLDRPHAEIVGGTAYYAHKDALGNVIALSDSTSSGIERTYAYDAWGRSVGGVDYAGLTGADRARFKGALWMGDETELYYMRARWYEPKSGRFLSEDPVGLAGGTNLHTYSANDPINLIDPTGLLACSAGVVLIIDDVYTPCTQSGLDAVDTWLRSHQGGTTLNQAWGTAGYTVYRGDGTKRTVCPEGFGSGMCNSLSGAFVSLAEWGNTDEGCFNWAITAMHRFLQGRFERFTGYQMWRNEKEVAYSTGYGADGVMKISSQAFTGRYNLANLISHEEYHMSSHGLRITEEPYAGMEGDRCGRGPRNIP